MSKYLYLSWPRDPKFGSLYLGLRYTWVRTRVIVLRPRVLHKFSSCNLIEFYPLFVFLKVFYLYLLQSQLFYVCKHVNVHKKFPFFTTKLLEVDKQKPWSRTNAPALVKTSMVNSQEHQLARSDERTTWGKPPKASKRQTYQCYYSC